MADDDKTSFVPAPYMSYIKLKDVLDSWYPDTSYTITDVREILAYSATYLPLYLRSRYLLTRRSI
jgi:hypothetical protein